MQFMYFLLYYMTTLQIITEYANVVPNPSYKHILHLLNYNIVVKYNVVCWYISIYVFKTVYYYEL